MLHRFDHHSDKKNQGTDKNNNPPRDDIDKFDAQEEN